MWWHLGHDVVEDLFGALWWCGTVLDGANQPVYRGEFGEIDRQVRCNAEDVDGDALVDSADIGVDGDGFCGDVHVRLVQAVGA